MALELVYRADARALWQDSLQKFDLHVVRRDHQDICHPDLMASLMAVDPMSTDESLVSDRKTIGFRLGALRATKMIDINKPQPGCREGLRILAFVDLYSLMRRRWLRLKSSVIYRV